MFAGTQADAYNQTNFYKVAIWTFASIPAIDN